MILSILLIFFLSLFTLVFFFFEFLDAFTLFSSSSLLSSTQFVRISFPFLCFFVTLLLSFDSCLLLSDCFQHMIELQEKKKK